MTGRGNPPPIRWHESLNGIVQGFLFVALCTSPCWGAALIIWAVRR